MRWQVCARTAALPRVMDEDAAKDPEPGAPLPLNDTGPGYAGLGLSGYADDGQAVALGAASLQGTVPMTKEWPQVTSQDARVEKSCSQVYGEHPAPAILLRGVRIPLAVTFRQLRVHVAIGGSRVTGPLLSRRREARRSALSRLPHLSTYDRRPRAISTLVTPLALHGVVVTSLTELDLRGLETAVVRAVWGGTRLPRAKEIAFTVVSKGHRVYLVMHDSSRWPGPPPTGSHPRLHPGYLGVGWPSSGEGPGGAPAPTGGHPWIEPTRGLVVLGRPGARATATRCAAAPTLAPKPGPGQHLLPFLPPA